MFDPSIFDNLKVAFENQLYDLDNLERTIRVTNRIDRMEMSVMSREFAIQFVLAGDERITAEIRLEASLVDLAAELLETKDGNPGCTLRLRFYMQVGAQEECGQVQQILHRIWPELTSLQTLSCIYGHDPAVWRNTAELMFDRKINEDQMGDIPELIEHVLRTLTELQAFGGS